MGTDIHGRVQRRYNAAGQYEDIGEIESGRNYAVFAMLAGVRNGGGFAGVRTHEPIQPISEPRGLPYDLGIKGKDWSQFNDDTITDPKVVNIEYSEAEFGDHSFSWVTLREVLDWSGWNAQLHRCGYVSRAEYERMVREGNAPLEWCGDCFGTSIIKTTRAAVEAGTAPEGWTDVFCEWETPFADSVKVFRLWLDYLHAKWGWLIERDPAAIRIVFGFDS